MVVVVDDVTPFGSYRPGWIRNQHHAIMNGIYRYGWLGRRAYGRLRWIENLIWSEKPGIADVERFGLRWRLYQHGNVSDSRILFRPDMYDRVEISSIAQTINPNFVFVDIGANIGYYSIMLANKFFKSYFNSPKRYGCILAIEPHPEIRRRLNFNLSLNEPCDVGVLQCAVSDQTGSVKLQQGTKNLGQTRISPDGSIEVEVRTLLDIVVQRGLDHIDAIKVDVEGLEDRVLGPFLSEAPEKLLPRVIIAEFTLSDIWEENWLSRAQSRGYHEKARTRSGNVILIR